MTYAAEVLADGPAWYLRLGESSGATAADTSGNSRPGTIAGTMTYSVTGALAGDANTAFTFDGATAKITVPDVTGDDSTGRTYETWIKTTVNTRTIMCRDISGSSKSFRLDVASNVIRYLHFDSAGTAQYLSGGTAVNDGAWHHVAVVVTNATSNATATIYIDGVADGSTTFASTDTVDTGADFTIGMARSSQWWSGSMDEVAYYRTALSSTRIAAHYTAATTADVDYVKTVTDPVGITDLPAEQTLELSLTLTDSVGLTDSPAAATGLAVAITDTVGVADDLTATGGSHALTVTITDGVGVADTVTFAPPPLQALNVVPLGRSLTPVLLVRVTAPSGAWVYLDQIGRVSGLSYSRTYPGGPSSAQWSLDVTPGAHIAALTQGSLVAIYRGTSLVWAGRVSGIDRGSPWRISADGKGSLAAHEPSATTGTLDAIVDQAITNGLPWTRPASLSTKTWSGGDGGQDVGTTMLDQVLTDVLLQDGKRWTVSAAGVVSAVTDPTVVSLLVRPDTTPPLVLGQYASEVTVRYQNSTGTYSTVRVTNATAAARFGRVAATLDTGYSVLTSAQATTTGQAWLDRHSPRMTLAGDITVTAGQITTATGGAVDLPSVKPGVLARLQVLPGDRDSLLVPTASVDVIVGATTYNASEGTLQLSPVNRAPSPGEVILGAAA